MKKRIFLKVKVLPGKEYRRLSRILKLRLGGDLDSVRAIFAALEYGCAKIDSSFRYVVSNIPYAGGYDPATHTIYITPETYDAAWAGDENALFTIVHEISHWAFITVFGIIPDYVVFELPALFASLTDAELYADTFACYLMMPQVMTSGGRKSRSFFRKILRKKKNGGIIKMTLVILKNRRCYNAVGYTTPPYFWAKKTA